MTRVVEWCSEGQEVRQLLILSTCHGREFLWQTHHAGRQQHVDLRHQPIEPIPERAPTGFELLIVLPARGQTEIDEPGQHGSVLRLP